MHTDQNILTLKRLRTLANRHRNLTEVRLSHRSTHPRLLQTLAEIELQWVTYFELLCYSGVISERLLALAQECLRLSQPENVQAAPAKGIFGFLQAPRTITEVQREWSEEFQLCLGFPPLDVGLTAPGSRLNEDIIGTALDRAGYRLAEIIQPGFEFALCFAEDKESGVPVEARVWSQAWTSHLSSGAFLRDTNLLSGWSHPQVSKIVGHSLLDGDGLFVAYEVPSGENLQVTLSQVGRVDVVRFAPLAIQLATILRDLEKAGAVYEGLSVSSVTVAQDPASNIDYITLVPSNNAMRLLPKNSLQRMVAASDLADATALAPEQYFDGCADVRSTIYSLGCIFYELLKGAPLFAAETYSNTMLQHAASEVDVSALPVSDSFKGVVLTCLAKDPEDRYQTIENLLKDLEVCFSTGSSRRNETKSKGKTSARTPPWWQVIAANGFRDFG